MAYQPELNDVRASPSKYCSEAATNRSTAAIVRVMLSSTQGPGIELADV